MRRIHVVIWLTVVGSLALFTFVASLAWRYALSPEAQGVDLAAEIAQGALPPADAPPSAQQEALERLSAGGKINAILFASDGTVVARVGPGGLGKPPRGSRRHDWVGTPRGPAWSVELPDGRRLVARVSREARPHPAWALFFTLAVVGIAVAVGTYPVVRRVTRRLERLKTGVEALGAGDLSARVKVEGRDEVATLATSFNRAAERIENLVGAHKTLLANASHELRSPLARIRMAVEMLKADARPALKAELERDIAELDQLIDEILLASRLDTVEGIEGAEDTDLLALAAEEAARVHAAVSGTPVTVRGNGRLLRRLVRNLLENAQRHGAGSPIEVSVAVESRQAVLRVCDRGPGVPAAERERIFEPFYRPAGSREREGSVGLGLALVRQIARKHGGDAVCLPRDGGGSCFEVRLAALACGA